MVLLAAISASAAGQIDSLLVPIAPPGVAGNADVPNVAPGRGPIAVESHTVLGAEAFVAELEKELAARLSLKGDLKLSLTRAWQPLPMPAEDFSITITEMPANGLNGLISIRVKISSGRRVIEETQVFVTAQLWQDAWVATNRLDRGQALAADLLSLQKVDVLRERFPLVSAESDPVALDLVTSVAAGRPLMRRDVTGRPVVRKGQLVEVVAQQGLIAISMKALALESGAAGDLIKLRNLESRREIHAEIINESKVQIRF